MRRIVVVQLYILPQQTHCGRVRFLSGKEVTAECWFGTSVRTTKAIDQGKVTMLLAPPALITPFCFYYRASESSYKQSPE